MSLGIFVALPEELRSLSKTKIKQGECLALSDNIQVILAGTGAKNAKKATEKLLANGVKQIISWGCAGALAPHLKSGDLIIPKLIQTQSNNLISTDTSLHKNIVNALSSQTYFEGTLIESSLIIASAKEKLSLFNKSSAIAVDMESAAAAQVCQKKNIPFIAIRTIVDPANFNLPTAISHSMTSEGCVSLAKLILYLISHPSEIPSLIQLGKHFKAANKKLKQISPLLTQVAMS
ncbi:MAG: phosphorylase [Methyloprofundus sp.]|nr:phosphorylase [Methyloprofundus sp.]